MSSDIILHIKISLYIHIYIYIYIYINIYMYKYIHSKLLVIKYKRNILNLYTKCLYIMY